MKLHLQTSPGIHIRSYGPGHVTLALPPRMGAPNTGADDSDGAAVLQALETLQHSFLLTPAQLVRDWTPEHYEQLAPEHIEPILALEPELVLLGTGASLRFPHPGFGAPLMQHGIGMEVMDTAAACRTYNILMAEGRHVLAALLMI